MASNLCQRFIPSPGGESLSPWVEVCADRGLDWIQEQKVQGAELLQLARVEAYEPAANHCHCRAQHRTQWSIWSTETPSAFPPVMGRCTTPLRARAGVLPWRHTSSTVSPPFLRPTQSTKTTRNELGQRTWSSRSQSPKALKAAAHQAELELQSIHNNKREIAQDKDLTAEERHWDKDIGIEGMFCCCLQKSQGHDSQRASGDSLFRHYHL
ncbi:hypothetical protein QTO34_005619 [Cnephaeus nilssonii]|uniref:Uncharacterized protein n=1 Tax=Cnephaeus nilssonii TaxID=3371016 RepID=A0AA40HNR5_CNENI|nr:hypothetical protein QTO34_005619 [Eptesicus nilssonii]